MNNPLSLNLYTCVHDNPLRYADPSGHKAWLIHGTWSSPDTWTDDRDNMAAFLEGWFKESVSASFTWSGGNSVEDRNKAAEDLAE